MAVQVWGAKVLMSKVSSEQVNEHPGPFVRSQLHGQSSLQIPQREKQLCANLSVSVKEPLYALTSGDSCLWGRGPVVGAASTGAGLWGTGRALAGTCGAECTLLQNVLQPAPQGPN